MKFSAAILAAVSAVAATTAPAGNVTYTTEVVTAYTTYCPEATTLTYGSQTYTITKATTLTITDCPCTISKPVFTSAYVACSTCTSHAGNATIPTSAVGTVSGSGPTKATGGVIYTPTPSTITAGAGKAMVASGAGLVGALAVALAL